MVWRGWRVAGAAWVCAAAGCNMPNPAWFELSISGSGSSSSDETAATMTGGDTSTTTVGGSESATGSTGTGEPTTTSATSGSTTLDVTVSGSDTMTSGGSSSTTATSGDTSTSTGDPTTEGSSTSEGTTTGGPECACADVEVPLDDGIFVLSDDGGLWKFHPDELSFEELGALSCAGVGAPFSMAVDRSGFAWVMFAQPAGAIRKVPVTNTLNCQDPGYVPGQLGVNYYGMAFASDDINDPCETLYGNTYDGGMIGEGPGLGKFLGVDPVSLVLSIIGPTTFNGAELTGTGDGRVYMFGGGKKGRLFEVDKTDGAYLEELQVGPLTPTSAFAFAFFAGDFYFFTESGGPGSKSEVTHFDYDGDQKLTKLIKAPIRVVGAGVSTCVPLG